MPAVRVAVGTAMSLMDELFEASTSVAQFTVKLDGLSDTIAESLIDFDFLVQLDGVADCQDLLFKRFGDLAENNTSMQKKLGDLIGATDDAGDAMATKIFTVLKKKSDFNDLMDKIKGQLDGDALANFNSRLATFRNMPSVPNVNAVEGAYGTAMTTSRFSRVTGGIMQSGKMCKKNPTVCALAVGTAGMAGWGVAALVHHFMYGEDYQECMMYCMPRIHTSPPTYQSKELLELENEGELEGFDDQPYCTEEKDDDPGCTEWCEDKCGAVKTPGDFMQDAITSIRDLIIKAISSIFDGVIPDWLPNLIIGIVAFIIIMIVIGIIMKLASK